MKIHEYQAKDILSKYNVPVPKGRIATNPCDAAEIALELGGSAVIKAQIHAGGRGKSGGIRMASSPKEAAQAAKELIGTTLVTPQTGPVGVPVDVVLVEELVKLSSELYLGMTIDGSTESIVAIASASGGMEIEEVAETTPSKIIHVPIDPTLGLLPFQGRIISYSLGVEDLLTRSMSELLASLYQIFIDKDCSLIEINPLGITLDNRILAMDAKLTIDDDAMHRQRNIEALQDFKQEDSLEIEARAFGINYVKLDGDIGCIVNGAGLAMATMDITHAAGAAPANFLDIGGGADEAKVAKALEIILSDTDVKTVLINIFGGILRCDVAARGFIETTKAMPGAIKPMIVRLLGTNAAEGRNIMANAGLDVILVDNLNQAVDAIQDRKK